MNKINYVVREHINMRYLFCLLFFITLISACTWTFDSSNKPPFSIPIEFSKAGNKVDLVLKIVEHNVYDFRLRFLFKEHDEADRSRVKNLTGGHQVDQHGKAIEPGVPMPVRLSVYLIEAENEKLVYSKEIDPILTSWGSDNFTKIIGYLDMKPARYHIRMDSLKDNPELANTTIEFTVGYDKFKSIMPE